MVKSEEGKNLGGPYKTHEAAMQRMHQVEYFKHKGKESKGSMMKMPHKTMLGE